MPRKGTPKGRKGRAQEKVVAPEKVATPEKAPPAEQDATSRRSGRPVKAKSDKASADTPEIAARSRRSSTAAQTAASVADSHSTRSSRGRRSSSASSESLTQSRDGSLESPRSRARSQRTIKRISYVESDGEEVVVKEPVLPEEEYNAEEDVESDSGDSTSKLAKGKQKAAVVSPRTRGRGRPVTKGKTPAKTNRAKKYKDEDEQDAEEDAVDGPVAPTRRKRYTEPPTDEDDSEDEKTSTKKRGKAKGTPASTRASRAAKRQEPTPKQEPATASAATPTKATRGRRNARNAKQEKMEDEETTKVVVSSKKRKLDEVEDEDEEIFEDEDQEVATTPIKKKNKMDNLEDEKETKSKKDALESQDAASKSEEEPDDEPMDVDVPDGDQSKDEKKKDVSSSEAEASKNEEKTNESKPESPEKLESKTSLIAEEAVKDAKVLQQVDHPKKMENSSLAAVPSSPGAKKIDPVLASPKKNESVAAVTTSSPKKVEPLIISTPKKIDPMVTSPKRVEPIVISSSPKKVEPLVISSPKKVEPLVISSPKKVVDPFVASSSPKKVEPSVVASSPKKIEAVATNPVPVSSAPKNILEPAERPVAAALAPPVNELKTAQNDNELKKSLPSSQNDSPSTNPKEKDLASTNGLHDFKSIDYESVFRGRKYVSNSGLSDETRARCCNRTFGVVCFNLAGEAPKPLENFVTSIRTVDSDLICLQAVSDIFYKGYLESTLSSLGYKGVFWAPNEQNSGFATFYKSTVFCLRNQKMVSLKQAIVHDIDTVLPTEDRPTVLSRVPPCGNALFTNFTFSGSADKMQTLSVANVLIPPTDLSVQALQISCLAREASHILSGSNDPLLLCGGFSMRASDASYGLLRDGYLSNDMIESLQSKKDIKVPSKDESTCLVNLLWNSFQHSKSGLKSSYAATLSKELHPTISPEMIWFSSTSLHTLGVLDVAETEIAKPGMQSNHHLLLKADLAFAV